MVYEKGTGYFDKPVFIWEEKCMLEKYNDIITVEELREILRIGKNKAYELVLTRQIPARKMGRRYVILKESVLSYVKENSI